MHNCFAANIHFFRRKIAVNNLGFHRGDKTLPFLIILCPPFLVFSHDQFFSRIALLGPGFAGGI